MSRASMPLVDFVAWLTRRVNEISTPHLAEHTVSVDSYLNSFTLLNTVGNGESTICFETVGDENPDEKIEVSGNEYVRGDNVTPLRKRLKIEEVTHITFDKEEGIPSFYFCDTCGDLPVIDGVAIHTCPNEDHERIF